MIVESSKLSSATTKLHLIFYGHKSGIFTAASELSANKELRERERGKQKLLDENWLVGFLIILSLLRSQKMRFKDLSGITCDSFRNLS